MAIYKGTWHRKARWSRLPFTDVGAAAVCLETVIRANSAAKDRIPCAPARTRWPPAAVHSASHGVHDIGKFGQEAIADVLYGPPAVLADLWLDQLAEMRFEAFVGPLFVRSH